MGHEVDALLRSPKVSSKVPAAPWDPTTLVTRSRAVQTSPTGIDVVVEEGEVDELPVEGVAPPVVEVLLLFVEQPDSARANPVVATIIAARDHVAWRHVPHRRHRHGVEVFRS
jgi:hypothetical protein